MVGKNNQTKQNEIEFELYGDEDTYRSPKRISKVAKAKLEKRNQNLGRFALIFKNYDRIMA